MIVIGLEGISLAYCLDDRRNHKVGIVSKMVGVDRQSQNPEIRFLSQSFGLVLCMRVLFGRSINLFKYETLLESFLGYMGL